jgi:hypothetical protein
MPNGSQITIEHRVGWFGFTAEVRTVTDMKWRSNGAGSASQPVWISPWFSFDVTSALALLVEET